MKTSINKEYAARHLFACLTMAGLFAWFAYDGFVKYPATPAEELYAQIEKSAPPESMSKEALETFKSQKTKSQISFAAVCLLLSAVVGLRLFSASRFSLEFDDDGFSCGGERFSYGDIKSIDDSMWKKKNVLRVDVARDGKSRTFVLDAWHHLGVKEFFGKAAEKTKENA